MGFDEAKFKRAWRKLCAERGIDPVEGATDAQARKAAHDQRAQALTLAHYARHPELVPHGGIAWRLRADWWTKPDYWHNPPERKAGQHATLPDKIRLYATFQEVEQAAILNVQRQANDAAEARFVEKVYNHPPVGRRRILRKFASGMELDTIARRDGVRQNVTRREGDDGIIGIA